MGIRSTRCIYAVPLLFFAVLAARPVWATLPTPNQPILVVQDSSSTDRYQNFVPELLTTEGLNGFQVAQLNDLTSIFLAKYDVVILPHLTLSASQVTLFQGYVTNGGTLIGFRPDTQLAGVFGVASLATTLQEGWLKIDTTTPYASALVSNVMKFHGTADLYSLSGASALATLYSAATLSTTSPAAAINRYGSGKGILFSFDLTKSIVLMRQGNPAWAGFPNTHDGNNTMRASQMFMDQPSGQFWNDLGDGALNDIPQADIQLRLFSNVLTLTNAARRPLPRLWYYPNRNRSMVLMTGDDHGLPVADALAEIGDISAAGGLFSYNLWFPFGTVDNSQVDTWLAAGYSMAIHFNDTGEVDSSSGVGGSAASWDGMDGVMTTALSTFAATYHVPPANAPYPVTTRNHFLIWVSNDHDGTPDQVAQAELFQNHGIQLDTSYASFPKRWGYMTGSGLPMKFLDPAAGSVIPVYEQATQFEDDIQLGNFGYSLNWNLSTGQGHYVQSLSDSLTKYNTVVTMLFHPEYWSGYRNYTQTLLQYAQSNSIPMSTTGSWLNFWQARAGTTLSLPTFNSGTLNFTATGSPTGLTLLVPFASGNNGVVSTFLVDGIPQSFMPAQFQGVMYASVLLTAGAPRNISVTYAPAGRIVGQISPSADASGATIQVQGGSITQNVPVAPDGTYAAGPLPPGTYTLTPVSASFMFSPSSRSVTLGATDVANVNFTGTFSGETLFTTQVPALTNLSDGPGVNYELGTAFTSDVAGFITGIRFWKDGNETGVHTGNIWSMGGQLLTSATFTNETSSGWQQQALVTPISIAANAQYVVSVNTTNTFYVATANGLVPQVVNGDLSSVLGGNGLFGTPGLFPTTNSSNHANYFRDIVFAPSLPTTGDTISPVTNATLLPAPNQNGWDHTDVMVAFSSRDNSGGSGVKNINFSLSGAQNSGAKVIPGNFATTIISAEGTTVVTFFATDRDGNQEKPKTITVRIDKGDPQISGMPQHACILSPANSQLIPVATVSAMDALSGISQGSFQVTAASNQSSGKGGPDVVITPLGNHGFRVFLRAENSGHGARIYTVTAKAIDLAGNSSLKTATCVVPPGKHGEHTGHDGDRSDSDEHDHNHDD